MKSRSLLLFAAVPAVLLLLGALSLSLLFEEVEEKESISQGIRARSNPLLGLEWTLDALGWDAVSSPELLIPETTDVALIVLPEAGRLSADEADRLLDWVEWGGSLAYSPPDFEDDPLLRRYGLRMEAGLMAVLDPRILENPPPEGAPEEDAPEEVAPPEDSATDESAEALVPYSPGFELEISLDPSADHPAAGGQWTLNSQKLAWLRGEQQLQWVAGRDPEDPTRFAVGGRSLGQGALVFIADATPFTNDRLGEADNAAFAEDVLVVFEPSRVQLVYRLEQEGMLTLLLRLAWPAAVSGLALLLAWLWLASRRFGTVYADLPAERRSLEEHLDAVGAFALRRGHTPTLLDNLRHSTLERLGGVPEEPEARVRWLVQRTRLPEETVRLALSPLDNSSPRALIERVRALETLRRSR